MFTTDLTRRLLRLTPAAVCCVCAAGPVAAQVPQFLGTVPVAQAKVSQPSGAVVPVVAGRASLSGNSDVTALNRNAEISFSRGGSLLLCQTSSLHVAAGAQAPALLVALDRGALELRTSTVFGDTILTPDLHFAPTAPGPIELNMRVAPNGDTCVDYRGKHAPLLAVVDSFGQSGYLLKPGQHVTFLNGSLRTVVDRETTPCGCPPDLKPVPLADALLQGKPGTVTADQIAAAYPFPEAQSAGLAPTPPREPDKPGQVHVQAATSLSFDPDHPATAQTADPADAAAALAKAGPARPATAHRGLFGSIGHFFHTLFVR